MIKISLLFLICLSSQAFADEARMLEVSRMLDQMALEQQLVEGETQLVESRLRLQEAQSQLNTGTNSVKMLPGLLGLAGRMQAPKASLILGDGRQWEAGHGDAVAGFRLEFVGGTILAHGCGGVHVLTQQVREVPCP